MIFDPRTRMHLSLAVAASIAVASSGCNRTAADVAPRADSSTKLAVADGTAPAAIATADPAAAPAISGRELLDRTAKAYREAKSYADAARVRMKVQLAGQAEQDPEPVDSIVMFQRPNKLKVVYGATVLASDGKKLRASVGDPSMKGQLLDLDAPASLSLADLMSGFSGPALDEGLSRGPAAFPIQVMLLLSENAQLAESGKPELLGDDTFDGHSCRRVRVTTDYGPEVFWIDPKTYTLRLVELPTDALRKQIEAEQGPVKHVSMTLELDGAQLNAAVPAVAFEFPVPDGATLVKRLIGPPPPAPSELLGKPVPEFSFTGVDGAPVSKKSLAGKVAVIDFWFTNCPPCQQSFPLLNSVYEKYKGSDRVAFVAVSIDPNDVGDAQIRDTARKWGGSFPLARDTAELAQKTLQVPGAPTLMVLGPDGTVQNQDSGFNPRLEADLPVTIEALLAGKSTADDAKNRYKQLVEEYNRAIQEPPAPTSVMPLPQATIAPHDEPKSLKLTRRWNCGELKAPDNILVVEDPRDAKAGPKLLVLDGPRTVVELSRDGKILARHELAIPQQAVVTFLRTAVDAAGHRYFAGSASGQQQFFLFDADWKLLLDFPKADQGAHAGIGDVQLVDLAGNGKLTLAVGYWQVVGVQNVSLDGQRIWTDRSMENVLRLATGPADAKGHRRLLCTNSRGSLVPLNFEGKPEAEWLLPGLMLETVLSDDSVVSRPTQICALARNTRLEQLAVGLGPSGEELWHYPMSQAIYTTPIEPLATIPLAHSGRQWLIAGPDGSINLVAFDGKPVDSFHYGAALTGLNGARFGDETLLLVSTTGHVEAWKVEQK
jgi:thiol-disulfide isomerase/thioredoxin/outer membrane lipoprotein-sorting protein